MLKGASPKLALSLALLVQWPAFSNEPPRREAPPSVVASRICQEMLDQDTVRLDGLRPEFRHNTDYTHEVAALQVRDQNRFGGCATYCELADLTRLIHQYTGRWIALSEPYLIFRALELKIKDAFADPTDKVTAGNRISAVFWVAQEFGIVPESAFTPRIAFETLRHPARMLEFINTRIEAYHLEVSRFSIDNPEREEILRQAQSDVRAILETYAGPMPSQRREFEFEGKRYNPRSFAREFIPELADKRMIRFTPKLDAVEPSLWSRIHRPDPADNSPESEFKDEVDLHRLPVDEIEERIVAALVRGENVLLSYENETAFQDRATGIMSISAFYTPRGYQPTPKNYRRAIDRTAGGHAVEIVGVDLDERGRVIKFKIRNSWGDASGDRGYFHMYADYFRAYVNDVYLFEVRP